MIMTKKEAQKIIISRIKRILKQEDSYVKHVETLKYASYPEIAEWVQVFARGVGKSFVYYWNLTHKDKNLKIWYVVISGFSVSVVWQNEKDIIMTKKQTIKKPSKDCVEKLQQTIKKAQLLSDCIEKRISYIVKTLNEMFGEIDFGWMSEFECGACGEINLIELLKQDVIWINFEGIKKSLAKNYNLILKDGNLWRMEDGFIPKRWLFEDFEQEIIAGRKIYLEEQEKQEDQKDPKE